MTSALGFEVIDGIPRIRLDEDEWAAVVGQTSVGADESGALTPLVNAGAQTSDPYVPDAEIVASAALALGPAPIRVDVTSVSNDAGVVASLGCDGSVAAGAARVLAVSLGDQPTAAVPGVELSLGRAQHLVSEVVRLLPSDPPNTEAGHSDPITLPHDQALVLTAAVRSGDEELATEVARQQGWDVVPEVLRSLAHEVRGNATVAIRVAGSDNMRVHRWLQCDLGWVGMSIADGQVVHTPCDREGIARELLHSFAGAFDFVLAEAQSHG